MNPIGALILIVLMGVVFSASRRVALLGMMAGVLFLTQTQQIHVLGFNFFAIRFLELAGFVRIMSRHEFSFQRLNKIDRALLWLYGFSTAVFLLRSSDGQANQIGMALDAFLTYFTFRGLVRDMDDFRWFLRAFIGLLAPYTLLVLVESLTGNNPFSVLGGTTGGSFWLRRGIPRCFGSFRQPDTLGMFAASFLPLYIGLACSLKGRMVGIFGVCLCLLLVVASNSGGPAGGAIMGLLGWGLWRFRMKMQKVRRGIVAMFVLLALTMKAPIWYIFDRASAITGGDGWHRSYLIDVSYQHLGQWWFAGITMGETMDWFPYQNAATGSADITNLYIAFGLTAGLGAIILLVILLVRAFSSIGKALALVRRMSSQQTDANEFLFWGLGAMLVVHIIDWFGVTYFDQMYVVWFLQLAMVATLTEKTLSENSNRSPEIDSAETHSHFFEEQLSESSNQLKEEFAKAN